MPPMSSPRTSTSPVWMAARISIPSRPSRRAERERTAERRGSATRSAQGSRRRSTSPAVRASARPRRGRPRRAGRASAAIPDRRRSRAPVESTMSVNSTVASTRSVSSAARKVVVLRRVHEYVRERCRRRADRLGLARHRSGAPRRTRSRREVDSSRSRRKSASSRNSRLPLPRITGKSGIRSSSTRSSSRSPADEVGAAVDDQVAAGLVLESGGSPSPRSPRRTSCSPSRGSRSVFETTYFGIARSARPSRRRSGAGRPEGRPDVEGRPAEEQRVRVEDLLAAERLERGVADLHRPGVPARSVLLEPGRLHHAVERHELDDDEPHRAFRRYRARLDPPCRGSSTPTIRVLLDRAA